MKRISKHALRRVAHGNSLFNMDQQRRVAQQALDAEAELERYRRVVEGLVATLRQCRGPLDWASGGTVKSTVHVYRETLSALNAVREALTALDNPQEEPHG